MTDLRGVSASHSDMKRFVFEVFSRIIGQKEYGDTAPRTTHYLFHAG